jgi:uncharacterized membrane protein
MLAPATGSTKINVGLEERVGSVFIGSTLVSFGLRRLTSFTGLLATVAGGLFLSRGVTGYCMVNNALGRNSANRRTSAMEAKETFIINKPRNEVYNFWRQLENLPSFMKHLESVKVEDSIRSTWKAKVPGGLGTVTWEAVITDDREGEYLSWTSLPGSTIDNAGVVEFKDSLDGSGTELKVHMTYRLPGGDVGTLAGKLFNPVVEAIIKEDLRRFKSIMETGELPAEDLNVATETKTKKTRQSRKKTAQTQSQESGSVAYNESGLVDSLGGS